jgi:hypothetical protein
MSIAAPCTAKVVPDTGGEIGEHRSYRAKSEFSHGQQARQNSSMQVGVEVF